MINKTLIVLLNILFCCRFCCSSTPVRRCAEDLPFPLMVQVDNCTALPCRVTKGTTTNIQVQFVAIKEETTYIESEVQVKVLGMNIPFEIPSANKNVCNNLMYGAYCPLYAEEDVTYNLEFPVDDSFLETNAKTIVKLRDFEDDLLVCFIVDMIISR